jgi:hypothetical protein
MCLFSYIFVSLTSICVCILPKSLTHIYRSHGHTATEVMDTQLYENKHIPKSWTHNYTKTNTYRSHGHTTIRIQAYSEVKDTKLYENKHISKSWTHNYAFGSCVSMTSVYICFCSRVTMTAVYVCFRIVVCP